MGNSNNMAGFLVSGERRTATLSSPVFVILHPLDGPAVKPAGSAGASNPPNWLSLGCRRRAGLRLRQLNVSLRQRSAAERHNAQGNSHKTADAVLGPMTHGYAPLLTNFAEHEHCVTRPVN